ncbi:hypothetical protein SARC_08318 [Sphaeroforma arctica JP610]|uniref:Uncharacterized protein n=1 Tax=Sphaeroforma arctica JP610 TaxID=667725 RepID=A0A0L0FRT7_9EUKA|nr:hypothetical protein SARC_08318 [Sphaeroforma arctica JP610]KNC79286.1 hypothetical protein SARC_08318 [Sphaeroforma arctica JP610]|eukprot:XP_014153188.1 hypothetical protein SARC_08318 [Sphaeroforma arctica JP610]
MSKQVQWPVVKWSPYDEDVFAVTGRDVRLVQFKAPSDTERDVSVYAVADTTVAETSTSRVLATNRYQTGISRKPCLDWMPERGFNLVGVPLINGDISLSVLHPTLSAADVIPDLQESVRTSSSMLEKADGVGHGATTHASDNHNGIRESQVSLRKARSIGNVATQAGGPSTEGRRIDEDKQNQVALLQLRNSRSCVAMQFNQIYPNLLACGYERHRGDAGLLIWDISKVSVVSEGANDSTATHAVDRQGRKDRRLSRAAEVGFVAKFDTGLDIPESLPRSQSSDNVKGTSDTPAFRPISHSEAVISLAWVPHTPHVLMAGVAGRHLRAYDVRAASDNPIQSVGTRAVHNLTFDPYRSHVFASISEVESTVKVWDMRSMVDPVMTIQTALPAVCMEWCPTRPGYLGCLSRNNQHKIEIYDINHARIDDGLRSGGTRYAVAKVRPKQMRHTAYELSSFHWHPHTPGRLVTISLDGVAESTRVCDPSPIGFPAASGGVDWITNQDILSASPFKDGTLPGRATPIDLTSTLGDRLVLGSDGGTPFSCDRRSSLPLDAFSGSSATPLPTELTAQTTLAREIIDTLRSDPSNVIHERALNGYGMDLALNIALTQDDPQLQALWSWLSDVEVSSAAAGLAAHAPTAKTGMAITSKTVPVTSSPHTILATQLKRKADMQAGIAELLGDWPRIPRDQVQAQQSQLTSTHNMTSKYGGLTTAHHEVSGGDGDGHRFFPVYRSMGRQAVQELMGWHFGMVSNPIEPVLQAMEEETHNEKAAAFSVFHCNLMRALTSLQLKIDEGYDSPELQLAIMGLSGYTDNRDSIWREWCSGYCSRMQDPYLRACFYFLTSMGPPFTDVLSETGMRLEDRVGFACRFLPDADLHRYIQETTESYILDGDLRGIALTGLTSVRGMELLERYLERTGDVQSVALAVAHVHSSVQTDSQVSPDGPDGRWGNARRNSEASANSGTHPEQFAPYKPKYEEWVDTYRDMLDRWQMWEERALFDVKRNLLVTDRSSTSFQMFVRCNLCNKTVQRSSSANANFHGQQSRAYNAMGVGGLKANVCPSCRKSLPKCSLCLVPVGTPSTGGNPAVTNNNNMHSQSGSNQMPISPSLHSRTQLRESGQGGSGGLAMGTGGLLHSASDQVIERRIARMATAPPSLTVNNHKAGTNGTMHGIGSTPTSPANINMNAMQKQTSINKNSNRPDGPMTAGIGVEGAYTKALQNPAMSPLSLWFSWCQNCRHGGHAGHITEWFSAHDECPVSACDCHCMLQDGVTMR